MVANSAVEKSSPSNPNTNLVIWCTFPMTYQQQLSLPHFRHMWHLTKITSFWKFWYHCLRQHVSLTTLGCGYCFINYWMNQSSTVKLQMSHKISYQYFTNNLSLISELFIWMCCVYILQSQKLAHHWHKHADIHSKSSFSSTSSTPQGHSCFQFKTFCCLTNYTTLNFRQASNGTTQHSNSFLSLFMSNCIVLTMHC
jgi:hypothetical protein